jgi:hypothetical protein
MGMPRLGRQLGLDLDYHYHQHVHSNPDQHTYFTANQQT